MLRYIRHMNVIKWPESQSNIHYKIESQAIDSQPGQFILYKSHMLNLGSFPIEKGGYQKALFILYIIRILSLPGWSRP